MQAGDDEAVAENVVLIITEDRRLEELEDSLGRAGQPTATALLSHRPADRAVVHEHPEGVGGEQAAADGSPGLECGWLARVVSAGEGGRFAAKGQGRPLADDDVPDHREAGEALMGLVVESEDR